MFLKTTESSAIVLGKQFQQNHVVFVSLNSCFLGTNSLQQGKNDFWIPKNSAQFQYAFRNTSAKFIFVLSRALGYFLYTGRVAMTSKGAKETIVSRLGFKSSSSAPKAEAELEKVRKENAHLRRKIDELAKRHIKPPDSDKSKLLEVKEVS